METRLCVLLLSTSYLFGQGLTLRFRLRGPHYRCGTRSGGHVLHKRTENGSSAATVREGPEIAFAD
jgi:hypothetical protein